jgi:anti-sigma regulatory factor (Ser/Thr protein kinase)
MVPERSAMEFLRSYPGHPSFAPQVRQDLGAFAERAGFSPRDVNDLRLAIGELLIFTLRPATGSRPAFRVWGRAYPDRIELEIEAGGERFITRTPVRDTDRDSLAPPGLGMQILRQLVTQLTFSNGGTAVRIVKRHSTGGSAG